MNLTESNKEFAKRMVRSRVNLTLDNLKRAVRELERAQGSLDIKDVRQADFIHDADLYEHTLALHEMIDALKKSIASGGILDEHFDRECAA